MEIGHYKRDDIPQKRPIIVYIRGYNQWILPSHRKRRQSHISRRVACVSLRRSLSVDIASTLETQIVAHI